jgi:hypothetical protein
MFFRFCKSSWVVSAIVRRVGLMLQFGSSCGLPSIDCVSLIDLSRFGGIPIWQTETSLIDGIWSEKVRSKLWLISGLERNVLFLRVRFVCSIGFKFRI